MKTVTLNNGVAMPMEALAFFKSRMPRSAGRP